MGSVMHMHLKVHLKKKYQHSKFSVVWKLFQRVNFQEFPANPSFTEKQEQSLQGQTEQHSERMYVCWSFDWKPEHTEISVNTVRKAACSRQELI